MRIYVRTASFPTVAHTRRKKKGEKGKSGTEHREDRKIV